MQNKRLKLVALFLALALTVAIIVLVVMLVNRTGEQTITTKNEVPTHVPVTTSAEQGTSAAAPIPHYRIDITPYEESVFTKDAAFLILVNRENSYGTIVPDNIVDSTTARNYSFSSYKLNKTMLDALEAMCLEACADGVFGIDITSAYRSYEKQEYLFNYYTEQEMKRQPSLSRKEAEAIVETYSCRAGTSEHQTGLAVDLRIRGDDSTLLEESFSQTQAGKWLAENCTRFGFVLRFPKDKTEITGIQFEPWHFRFVGYTAAQEMKENEMCLEEYCAYLDSIEE